VAPQYGTDRSIVQFSQCPLLAPLPFELVLVQTRPGATTSPHSFLLSAASRVPSVKSAQLASIVVPLTNW